MPITERISAAMPIPRAMNVVSVIVNRGIPLALAMGRKAS